VVTTQQREQRQPRPLAQGARLFHKRAQCLHLRRSSGELRISSKGEGRLAMIGLGRDMNDSALPVGFGAL